MNDISLSNALATLKFGSVSDMDIQRHKVRVILPELGGLETAWLPVLTRKSLQDKDYWMLDKGEQVAVLLDARGEDGVVLGAIFSDVDKTDVNSQDKWQRRFNDGAVLEYDRKAHQLTVNGGVQHVVVETQADITLRTKNNLTGHSDDAVLIEGGNTITIKAGSKVSINAPATEISGTLTVQGAITGQGGLAISGGSGASVSGDMKVSQGSVTVSGGDVTASGKSLVGHIHQAQGPSSPTSAPL
ncbi:phage baseplate assembly protein V [Chromobacterium sp. IIBBL 290-4]|uniref:phage baseplate assembly protein V n=1 Tax=Chromobacterium sp. IIBBL 290-4 TaxID=2953890 RepID=UPI0020B71091|nr:phage baseplate assembly protein V [Chromobacterium sp. IIBBL 290-4]UTH76092.1 phage baseplate assembly protein V [Chromobacterium sp. IIBBL 290-4]